MFRELCGDTTLKNVVLVTNMWGEVTQDVGEARERELTTNFFRPVLNKGAQIARHHYNPQSAHDIIRRIMKNQPFRPRAQRESTGGADREEFEEFQRRQAELNSLREEMEQALRDKEEGMRKVLEEENRKVREELDRLRVESERLASVYREERRRMEAEMWRIQEEARVEREQLLDDAPGAASKPTMCGGRIGCYGMPFLVSPARFPMIAPSYTGSMLFFVGLLEFPTPLWLNQVKLEAQRRVSLPDPYLRPRYCGPTTHTLISQP